MMNRPLKEKQGGRGNRNVLVYGLIVLAIALSGLATWQRYAHQRSRSELADAFERGASAWARDLGVADSWTPTGGLRPDMAAARMCWFTCPQCLSSCWTYARGSGPACSFCGLAMARQGFVQPGVEFALAGGTGAAGTAWPNRTAAETAAFPIRIRADAVRPHVNRGACTNCHTVVRSGAPSSGMMGVGAARGSPKAAWRGATAPAIAADAVKPTLIEEFGMEVAAVPGGVKITGVMGNSYAWRAGVTAGDILIECNGAKMRDPTQFQQAVSKMVPESSAKIKILRNGRTRDLTIMVGEGEMEGFMPIQRP